MAKFQLNAKTAAIIVIIGSALAGLVGPLDRMLEEYAIDYFASTFYRALITVVILAVLIVIIDRTLFKIKKEHILLFIILGLCKGFMDISYVHSQSEITLSLSTVLQMTAPYFVILFSYIIFKDKITKKKVIAVIIGSFSACLMSNVFTGQGDIGILGVVLAIISAITFAGYMMSTAILIDKGYHFLTVLFYAFLITVFITMPSAPIVNTVDIICQHPETIGYLIVLGIGCTLIPYMFDAIGVKYVDVTAVTVFSMVEIVVSAVMGYLCYGEPLNIFNIFGMLLLLVSMLMINDKKQEHGDAAEPASEGAPPDP